MATTASTQEISHNKEINDGRDIPAWKTLLANIKDLWKSRNPKSSLKAFISYAWEDTSIEEGKIANSKLQRYLENLRDDLQEAGISVFLDIGDMHGHMKQRMEDNVNASNVVITIHTPRFKARAEAVPQTSLGFEYELILKKAKNIPYGIFPLHYSGNFNDAFPDELKEYFRRDCRDLQNYTDMLVAIQRPLGIIPAIYGIKCNEDPAYQSLFHQWINERVNKLPHPNSYFVGREALLTEIEKSLEKGTSTIYQQSTISGLGGIGKSSLVLAYAHKHGDKYKMRRWLNVAGTNIRLEFEQLASELGMDPKGMNEIDLAANVYRRIGQINTWLLIFDDADDYKSIQIYLPKKLNLGQHILITSRSQHWNQGISLAYFSPEEAVAYITKFLPYASKQDAALLANELGGLPLALGHAASYMRGNDTSIQKYIELYRNKGIELLQVEGHDLQGNNYPHNVLTTWALSMEKIKQQAPQAAKMLEICSYLAPDNIPIELFTDADLLENRIEANEAIRFLKKYSLVGASTMDDHIQVHSLVQAVTQHRYELKTDQQKIAELLTQIAQALARYFPREKVNEVDLNKARLLLPHLYVVIKSLDRCTPAIKGTISEVALAQSVLQSVAAHALMELGKYKEAKELYKKGLAIKENIYSKNNIELVDSLNDLGNVLNTLGEYREAKESLEKALTILEKSYFKNNLIVVSSLATNLGNSFMGLGDYVRAKELYENALMIAEQCYLKEHVEVANILENLGNVLRNLGRYDKAKQLLEKALVIKEKYYGKEHMKVASTLSNLSLALIDLGDYDRAKKLGERALERMEKHYDKGNIVVAMALSNLALVLNNLEEYNQAKELYDKVLVIEQNYYGENHPEIAKTLKNIGDALIGLKDYHRAKELYEKAIEIMENNYGKEHIEVANTLWSLGNVLRDLKEYQKAKEVYKKALERMEKHYDKDHIAIAKLLNNLALVFIDLKEYQEAQESYEESLRIMEKYYGKDHPDVAMVLYNLSALYMHTKNNSQALETI